MKVSCEAVKVLGEGVKVCICMCIFRKHIQYILVFHALSHLPGQNSRGKTSKLSDTLHSTQQQTSSLVFCTGQMPSETPFEGPDAAHSDPGWEAVEHISRSVEESAPSILGLDSR